jgi:hypothetical protein
MWVIFADIAGQIAAGRCYRVARSYLYSGMRQHGDQGAFLGNITGRTGGGSAINFTGSGCMRVINYLVSGNTGASALDVSGPAAHPRSSTECLQLWHARFGLDPDAGTLGRPVASNHRQHAHRADSKGMA